MKRITEEHHRTLALWAAGCAGHVLVAFERHHPGDDRPRKAIEGARLWARGQIRMSRARTLALAAHAAAREAADPQAIAAARSAGHAAATAHMAAHAQVAATYAQKAAADAAGEWEWQMQQLPGELQAFLQDGNKGKG